FPEEKLKKLQQHFTGPLLAPINSVGIKVGLLVREQGDIYVNHHGVSYWDTCAPQVILEEAGGAFTGSDGQIITYSFSEPYRHEFCTVASNGVRHDEILKHLKGLL
ncbi:MAG: hypothetical protein JNK65_02535, partial [Deltaproteobacteria bacterium]|nr:hypothetical protein [Deltaproteobacteria bacterium]